MAEQSYANGYEHELTPEGFYSEEIERGMIEDGHVLLTIGIHNLKARFKHNIDRHGRQPFRISKEPATQYESTAGVVIRKFSPLKDVLEPIINRLRQADIIDQFTRSYYYFWAPDAEDKELLPLGFNHLIIVLEISGVGFLISFCILLFEVMLYKANIILLM